MIQTPKLPPGSVIVRPVHAVACHEGVFISYQAVSMETEKETVEIRENELQQLV